MQISDSFTITAGTDSPDIGYSKILDIGSISGTLRGYTVTGFIFVDSSGDEEIILTITGTNEPSILNSISYTGESGAVTLNASDAIIDNSTDCQLVYAWVVEGNQLIDGNTYAVSFISNAQVNCGCDEETDNETLSALRRRLLIRLGYSAQADNPPPGMADLLTEFLTSSQRFMYRKYKQLRTTRFFTWTMVPGQRFYDLPGNDEASDKRLDPNEVEWVGFEDLNGVWLELYAGIPPEFYTSVNFLGYPTRYEIRQCIEVFPAPAAAYKLRIKGRFGLTAFTADDDVTTIDSELVFQHALGTAKLHYSQPDGQSILAGVMSYLKGLNAGTHTTARYVPGTSPAMPWTRPKFLPIGNS